ncbi:DUF2529 domain-containing protein [Bacillus sp. FJAT-45066]|uniref:DUF2529 domain-containing protein n=1 Tax=Bacillus sp. FJAT-45066 TaxID=2011010 RepID=UPI000BB92189|nr:DUF2529 domain-containing protein [Bacillus sp. FJAT-45066]
MLKIFMTQLSGVFKKIASDEEFGLEDGARVLAQAVVGDGHVYVAGFAEMKAVVAEAVYGAEPLIGARELEDVTALKDVDRVLIVSRSSTDVAAVELAKQLQARGIGAVGISTVPKRVDGESLTDLVDNHIDLQLYQGLIPDEDGSRFGYPSSLVALFAYHGLAFTVREIVRELEEE